jgi:hypothetical protein
MYKNFGFWGIFRPYNVTITNVNFNKSGFALKFRPKRFYKIDSRLKDDSVDSHDDSEATEESKKEKVLPAKLPLKTPDKYTFLLLWQFIGLRGIFTNNEILLLVVVWLR